MATATTEIRAITIDEMQAQAGSLTHEHWKEVGEDGVRELAIDWQRYRLVEASGMLVALGAFVDGEFAGYSIAIRASHGHDMGEELLQGDAIFVGKQHRGTGLGLSLLRRNEAIARETGVDSVLWGGPEDGPLVRLLKRMHENN